MRDNDQIILEDCYSKIKPKKHLLVEQEENVFRYKIKSDIFVRDENKDSDLHFEDPEVIVKFKIIAEPQDWGLDIFVRLLEIEPFTLTATKWGEDEDETYTFPVGATDLSNVDPTYEASDDYGMSFIQIAPKGIQFYVEKTKGMESRKGQWKVSTEEKIEVAFSH